MKFYRTKDIGNCNLKKNKAVNINSYHQFRNGEPSTTNKANYSMNKPLLMEGQHNRNGETANQRRTKRPSIFLKIISID